MSATPELKNKSWHLNDIIKKILWNDITPLPPVERGVYWKEDLTLNAPNTDTYIDDTFVFQSGKGVISGHNLNLAQNND